MAGALAILTTQALSATHLAIQADEPGLTAAASAL